MTTQRSAIRAATAQWLLAALTASATMPALAAADHYTIDPDHTYPSFEADHLGISVWRGKMTRTTGGVVLDKAAGTGSVDVTVDLSSIDFGLDTLNTWAEGTGLFDTNRYPTATYTGKLGAFIDGAPTRVVGNLTLHGVTRPLVLEIATFKCIPHPVLKRELCGADATASFDRSAFGLDAGKAYGFSMEVKLRIQVEALKDG